MPDAGSAPWGDLFSAVKYGRSSNNIALQIQQAIYQGHLELGRRLPNERDLGALFGVSRSTLREAIRMLEAEGIVEVRRGTTGGTFVSQPKVDRVGFALAALIRFQQATPEHFVEFRLTFEPESARIAATSATAEQRARLMDLAQVCGEGTSQPDTPWDVYISADIDFHAEVANATGNPIRYAVMLGVHEAFRQSSLSISRHDTPVWRAERTEEVLGIAHAIRDRKPSLAHRRMKEHLTANVAVITEMLNHR